LSKRDINDFVDYVYDYYEEEGYRYIRLEAKSLAA
jgi:hypothetical protein